MSDRSRPAWALTLALSLRGMAGCSTSSPSVVAESVDASCSAAAPCDAGLPCEDGASCESGASSSIACTSDASCPENARCDTTSGECVYGNFACRSDADCSSGNYCLRSSGLCISGAPIATTCASDTDCKAPWQFCDSTLGVCVAMPATCTSDAECPTGWTCDVVKQGCVTPSCPVAACTTTTDCVCSGSACNTRTGECD